MASPRLVHSTPGRRPKAARGNPLSSDMYLQGMLLKTRTMAASQICPGARGEGFVQIVCLSCLATVTTRGAATEPLVHRDDCLAVQVIGAIDAVMQALAPKDGEATAR